MAKLINCKSCGETISMNAAACPQCGEPQKATRKPVGCGGAITIFFLIFVVYMVFQSQSDKGTSTEPKRPLTAEEVRANKIVNQFSIWNGAHHHLQKLIKQNLKDPDSYEHIETTYRDDGKNEILVDMKYRAKNSFGGYVVGHVVAKYTIDGQPVGAPITLNE